MYPILLTIEPLNSYHSIQILIIKPIINKKDIMEELSLLNLIYVIDIVKSVKNMVIRMIINYAFPVYKIIDILMIRNLIQIVFPMDIFMMIV